MLFHKAALWIYLPLLSSANRFTLLLGIIMLNTVIVNLTANICLAGKARGECGQYLAKWYFNAETGVCKRFYYGGCGGNMNRFDTEQECIARCSESLGRVLARCYFCLDISYGFSFQMSIY